jgi:hypothetical protein
MRSKELSVELRDRIVSRHKSEEGYQTISAELKVPKNTVASITLKWKNLEPPRLFLELTYGQTEQSGKKGLGQRGDQEPDCHSDRGLEFLCGDGRTFQKDTISAALHQSGRLSKRHTTAHLEFSKRHLKDSQIFWSDESNIEVFGLIVKRHVCWKPDTIPTVKHNGCSIMLWRCLSVAGTGRPGSRES